MAWTSAPLKGNAPSMLSKLNSVVKVPVVPGGATSTAKNHGGSEPVGFGGSAGC